MIRSLEFLIPTPHHMERRKELEIELIIDHAYIRKLPKTPIAALQAGEHIIHSGRVMYPSSTGTEAPMFRTLPDLTLGISSSDCSSVSCIISLSFVSHSSKLIEPEEGVQFMAK